MTRTEYLARHAYPTPSALPHGGRYRTLSLAPYCSVLTDRMGRILVKGVDRFRYVALAGGAPIPPDKQRWFRFEPGDGPFRLMRLAEPEDLEIPSGP